MRQTAHFILLAAAALLVSLSAAAGGWINPWQRLPAPGEIVEVRMLVWFKAGPWSIEEEEIAPCQHDGTEWLCLRELPALVGGKVIWWRDAEVS